MDKQNPQEYTNMLLEEIRAKFSALSESLELVKEKVEANFEMINALIEEMRVFKKSISA